MVHTTRTQPASIAARSTTGDSVSAPFPGEPSPRNELDPCHIGRIPADRFVRTTTFVPLKADLTHGGSGSGSGEEKALQRALKTHDNDMSLAYLELATQNKLRAFQSVVGGALDQDLGFLFLDQLRIRPKGAVIGDLVYVLGLAPRERVVLTQKAWTKRNVSLEDMLDETTQRQVEFTSAFSTEIGENIDHQQQTQTTQNVGTTVTGGYGPVSISVNSQSNASDATQENAQLTAKRSQETTRKVTDQAKKEHRVTMKLETETGVEDVSQRSFENPNTCHSLMLSFYRVFQRFEMIQERWGLRACWAPCIADPGRDLRPTGPVGMTAEQRAYLDAVKTWVPDGFAAQPQSESKQSGWSEKIESGIFGVAQDVKTQIDIPKDYVLMSIGGVRKDDMTWGNLEWPHNNLNPNAGTTGPASRYVWWHIGLKCCVPATLFTPANCPEPWAQIATQYEIAPSNEAEVDWAKSLQDARDAEYARRLAEVQKQIEGKQQSQDARPPFDPVTELMRRVVAERLQPSRYNTCSEVTMWQSAFEWDAVSYDLFPSWWTGQSPDGQQSSKPTFLTASWAKLYVPVRPGWEKKAFWLVYGSSTARLTTLADEIEQFRTDNFGPAGADKVITIARWEELMPTDGTYVEPVVGQCEACDKELAADIRAQRELVEAQTKALERS